MVTFWFALFSAMIGQLVLGLVSAMLLSRPLRGRPLFNAIILMPNAVPEVVAALMWASMLAGRRIRHAQQHRRLVRRRATALAHDLSAAR